MQQHEVRFVTLIEHGFQIGQFGELHVPEKAVLRNRYRHDRAVIRKIGTAFRRLPDMQTALELHADDRERVVLLHHGADGQRRFSKALIVVGNGRNGRPEQSGQEHIPITDNIKLLRDGVVLFPKPAHQTDGSVVAGADHPIVAVDFFVKLVENLVDGGTQKENIPFPPGQLPKASGTPEVGGRAGIDPEQRQSFPVQRPQIVHRQFHGAVNVHLHRADTEPGGIGLPVGQDNGMKPQTACPAGSLVDPFFGSAYQKHAGALLRPTKKLADLLNMDAALPHFLEDTPDGALTPWVFRKLLLHHQIYHR